MGCGVSNRTKIPAARIPASLESSAAELIARYNQQARAVSSINAGVELNPVAGSAYSGVIEDYRDIRGFILAQRPESIRMIGQAPVISKNIFDMVSDGKTFRIHIPSKNKFIVGPADFERVAKKPIENLRPQHLLDAIFWPELPSGAPVLFEEFVDDAARYYVLTLLKSGAAPETLRKIWFDRANLQLSRVQVFGPAGRLLTDTCYSEWSPVGDAAGLSYPRLIRVARPRDDYSLEVRITKLTLNEQITADRFELAQPPGSELVRVGDEKEQSNLIRVPANLIEAAIAGHARPAAFQEIAFHKK